MLATAFVVMAMLGLQPDTRGHTAVLDDAALRASLEGAPAEFSGVPGVVVLLPLPDGSFEHVEAWSSPIMHPELAAKYPSLRTFIFRGLDEPSAVGRLDLSPAGLHAILRHPRGAALVSASPGDVPGTVVSRLWTDATTGDWECGVGPEHGAGAPVIDNDDGYQPRGPLPLRTFRFVMACTGEFAEFHSARQGNAPNLIDALAAVVTITNRVNFIVEQDVAVRLILVANNDQVVFLDPVTDPYHPTDSGANLSANISTCGSVIGNANFDHGHLVTRIPGGVAYLNSPCGNNKAGAVSGRPRSFEPDPLAGDVVMHEVGHQLGGNHTFNGSIDRCQSNRNSSTAWEPGSGTTIIAYAGNCPVGNAPPSDNIQISRDIMYHHGSIGEMRNFLNGSSASCAAQVVSGNTPPVFGTLPSSFTIPKMTPFSLTGTATDADGDTITYSWEQRDLGPQQPLSALDNGTSPLFRVFMPVAVGTRLFPELADCLAGIPDPTEELPSVSPATRRFRLTARDNHPGAGGVVTTSNIVLTVADAGPFMVTEPVAGQVLSPGVSSVRWDVAGTTGQDVNVQNVAIDLSLDGGATFSIPLVASVANNGATLVTLPEAWAGDARIRVRAIGNVFFSISAPFTIQYCDGDVNCDFALDGFDVESQERAVGGDMADYCQPDADFNHDFALDGFDVEAVEVVVGGGPCP